jgi:hypothetical protein
MDRQRTPATSRARASIRKAWICLGALTSLLVAGQASANFTCEGEIQYLGLSPEGAVSVHVGFGVWYICNQTVSITTGGVTYTPEGCRAWYATILAAQKAGTKIRFFFSSPANTSNGAECSAIGSWLWPSPAPYHMNVY